MNPRTLIPILFAIVALCIPACSRRSAHEQVVDEIGMQMDRMAVVVSSVTDKASAEKAVAHMKTIVGDLQRAEARSKALAPPDAALRATLAARMKRKTAGLEKSFSDSQSVLARAGPEATTIMLKGMKDLAPDMDRVIALYSDPGSANQ